MSILKRGLKGAPVKRLQEKLGIAADGDYGPGTEAAVKEFQSANGLAADGIAGPDTFTAMGLHELVLLRVGSRGDTVKKVQADLGIGADGIFGKGTEAAVKEFQAANGLDADGLVGPETLAKLSGFAGVVTEEVVAKAEVQADEEHFEEEALPEIKGASIIPDVAKAVAAPQKAGVWGRVKGWFS